MMYAGISSRRSNSGLPPCPKVWRRWRCPITSTTTSSYKSVRSSTLMQLLLRLILATVSSTYGWGFMAFQRGPALRTPRWSTAGPLPEVEYCRSITRGGVITVEHRILGLAVRRRTQLRLQPHPEALGPEAWDEFQGCGCVLLPLGWLLRTVEERRVDYPPYY